jgi:hypothetical protein
MHPALSTILAVIATILLAVAALLTLAVNLSTNLFTARPPQGEQAMGLLIVFGAALGALALALIAAWIGLARGNFDLLSVKPMVPFLIVTAVTLGVGLAPMGSVFLWSERTPPFSLAIGPLLGVVTSLLAPAALFVWIAASLWMRPADLAEAGWPKTMLIGLAVIALYGLGCLAWGTGMIVRQNLRNTRAVARDDQERESHWAAIRAMSPVERTELYLREFAADGPAWHLCMSLFHERDEAARRLIVARIAECKDLDAQLISTMASEYASLRGGALDYIIEGGHERGPPRDEIADAVGESIRLLADDIRASRGAMSKTLDAPFAEEVERSIRALRRCPAGHGDGPLKALQAAVRVASDAEARSRAMRAIEALGGD